MDHDTLVESASDVHRMMVIENVACPTCHVGVHQDCVSLWMGQYTDLLHKTRVSTFEALARTPAVLVMS